MCECYQVGGPWIAEDPDCPAHGRDGYEAQLQERDDRITQLEAIIVELEADIQEYADCQPPI